MRYPCRNVWLIPLLSMFSVALFAGCQTSQQPTPVGATQASSQDFEVAESSTDWPFWPTSMRVHPLTRVMDNSEDQQRIVEVRIEFSDQFGSTTRSAGQLRLELIDRSAGGEVVEEWNNDLRSESSNALHFDDITRTYLFRLELDSQYSTRDAELRAYFLSIDNSRLTATYRFQR